MSAEIVAVAMNRLDPPVNASRFEIDAEEVSSLAANIAEVGLLNPILARPVDGRFEVVAGHRRYLALRSLKKESAPCIVREMSDLEAALARASENRDRIDLSPIEEATEYQTLVESHRLSIDEVARKMGKSPGVVKRRLDLLKMCPALQKAIHSKQITYGVAEEFNRLHDTGVIDYYLGYAVDHGITVQVARQWVNDHKKADRLKARDVEGTGGVESPLEESPTYVTCDLCHGPTDVRDVQYIKSCKGCLKTLNQALGQ